MAAGAGEWIGSVESAVNYVGRMAERPRFYANDHSRDVLVLEPHRVVIADARRRTTPPALDREGFVLAPHKSAVADFHDREAVARSAPGEVERLVIELTGADRAVTTGAGVLRFGEGSADSGRFDNSLPARFVHIDASDATARQTAERLRPAEIDRPLRRYAHFNIWRALSPPPQDIPLALCDARSLAAEDLVAADAVFDHRGQPERSFESLVIRHSPRHRWYYFPDMSRDEALVFKTKDSDPREPHHVPHSAFDDPTCPPGVPPRASIEMRVVAYWFA